jgi:hypothetical protein
VTIGGADCVATCAGDAVGWVAWGDGETGDEAIWLAGGAVGSAKRSELSSAGTLTVRSLLNASGAADDFADSALGAMAGAAAIGAVGIGAAACAGGNGSPG